MACVLLIYILLFLLRKVMVITSRSTVKPGGVGVSGGGVGSTRECPECSYFNTRLRSVSGAKVIFKAEPVLR